MGEKRRFEGKVALVTGGNGGIGLAAAEGFAREGASVVIAARRKAEGEAAVEKIVAAGGIASFVETDVTDEASVEAMVVACVDRYGGLDVAYNNAGITGSTSHIIADAQLADFEQVMAINVRGVWLSMKYEFRAMQQRGGGAIVNCSSTAGISGGAGRASPYYASKHAVMGMTKQVAVEGSKLGIRVNAVMPGMVMTDIVRNNFADNQEKLQLLFSRIPMGRSGETHEVANAVLWLCSDESSYVTGAGISVDGGTVI